MKLILIFNWKYDHVSSKKKKKKKNEAKILYTVFTLNTWTSMIMDTSKTEYFYRQRWYKVISA